MAAQVLDGGHRPQRAEPAVEALLLLAHQRLGAHGLAPALLGVVARHLAQVVDVVEVDVVEVVDLGLGVARHADVDDEDRLMAAASSGPPSPARA